MSDRPPIVVRSKAPPVDLADEAADVNPRSNRRASQQRVARLILAGALILLGLWVLSGFLGALGWAMILAIATWPLYDRFLSLVAEPRRRILAPVLFTFLIALVFVAPLAVAAVAAGRDLNGLIAWALEAERSGVAAPDWLAHVPFMGDQIKEWWSVHLAEPGAVTELLGYADKGTLARLTREIGILIARRLTFFLFTVLTLFFLFKDGVMLGRRFRTLSHRIFGKPGEHLVDVMVSAIRSTADGLVLVGLGEGAFLAIGYVVAGVPHPALLGTFTGLLAMIPFGAPVIFGAASLLLLVKGSLPWAIGLFAYGMVVVLVADHAIRPVLIGGAAKLPFLWVLLGIFGGLATFGVLGLFLGPAIMAALVSLWREWTEPHRQRSNLPLV